MDLDRSPALAFWEVTQACPLACRHCRASAIHDPRPGQLTTEEGERLIRDLTRFGDRPPVLILTGGDPLARPDLFHLIEYARSAGLTVGLAPAVGPNLDDGAIGRLRDLGVKAVSVSLDGARPETHDGIRRVPGHFWRTLATLDALLRARLTVQVNTTVMRENVRELADVATLLVLQGVGIWEVFFLVRTGRGADVAEITPRQHLDVANFLFDASRYGLTVRTVEAPFFRPVVERRRAASADADPSGLFPLGRLYGGLLRSLRRSLGPATSAPLAQSGRTRDGKGIVFVAHDGEIFPAGFLPVSLGNVRRDRVVDVYRSHPLLRAIRRAEFTGRCGDCVHRDLCGGSRARAYAASGDPLAEDPACPFGRVA